VNFRLTVQKTIENDGPLLPATSGPVEVPANDQRFTHLFKGDIRYPRFKMALEAVMDETTGAQPIREYIAWVASYTGH
jgi:hypothetical protein